MVLNDVCEVYSGYALKSFNEGKEGFPVIKIGNILTDGRLSLEDCQYTTETVNTKYYSQKDDVYVALSGATTGKIGLMETDESYVINQRVGVVRRKDKKIPSRFIKYFLLKQTERILQEAAGCAQPNISPKQIGAYTFPSFSSEKMEEITRELDKVTNVIQYRYKQNNLLDCLIKARFVEMFDHSEFPMLMIEELCSDIVDCPHSTPTYEGELKNPAIRTSEIKKGYILWDSMRYVSDDEYEKRVKRLRPKSGDIVYGREGTFGNAAVLPDGYKFCLGQRVMLLRPDHSKCTSEYLLHAIISDDVYRQAMGKNNASTVAHVNVKDVKQFKVPLPPLEKQKIFASFIKQVDKSKVAIQKSLAETQLLFDKLMQDYFG